jgi:hypothetical protein
MTMTLLSFHKTLSSLLSPHNWLYYVSKFADMACHLIPMTLLWPPIEISLEWQPSYGQPVVERTKTPWEFWCLNNMEFQNSARAMKQTGDISGGGQYWDAVWELMTNKKWVCSTFVISNWTWLNAWSLELRKLVAWFQVAELQSETFYK